MKTKKNKSGKQAIGFNLNHYLGNYPLNSRFAESYRTLRTNVQFSFMKKEFKCLLVSSATQSEGKTITVANLAYSLAQDGKTVIMVDTDLRKPSLSKIATTNNSVGVTGLLSEVFFKDIGDGSLKELSVEDLFILTRLQKGSGLLKLKEGLDTIEFMFLNGKLVDMNWTNRSVNKGLIAYLVKNDLLSPENAQECLSIQKQTGQKLSFILNNTGLVKKQNLVVPLTIFIMKGLRTALQFKTGGYFFKKLAESDIDSTMFDPVDYPKIYKQLLGGVSNIPFLQKKINSAIVETETENLALLPSGSIPPNPSELLGSERMSFLISNLKKKFDILIFDTPPVLPASDALLLSPYTDGVLLIVKAGEVNRELIKKAVEQFKMAHANLLGVILNKVDARIGSYYYKYYNKYYSSYYGENR
jgi:capsular exopolysaccharide synthesis family protein